MADFSKAVEYVLKNEVGPGGGDGLTDDPNDRGGRTRWGITKALASKYGIPIDKLTRAGAVMIYRSEFWPPIMNEFLSQRVATKLLDMAVNFGSIPAIRLLQDAVSDLGPPVAKDGVLGPMTVAAANVLQEYPLLMAMGLEAARRYADIAAAPSQVKFLRGWIYRALKMPERQS